MSRYIFGRKVTFNTASIDEPFWWFYDDQGFWHRSLFTIEIVRREEDNSEALALTIGRWQSSIVIKNGA